MRLKTWQSFVNYGTVRLNYDTYETGIHNLVLFNGYPSVINVREHYEIMRL